MACSLAQASMRSGTNATSVAACSCRSTTSRMHVSDTLPCAVGDPVHASLSFSDVMYSCGGTTALRRMLGLREQPGLLTEINSVPMQRPARAP